MFYTAKAAWGYFHHIGTVENKDSHRKYTGKNIRKHGIDRQHRECLESGTWLLLNAYANLKNYVLLFVPCAYVVNNRVFASSTNSC